MARRGKYGAEKRQRELKKKKKREEKLEKKRLKKQGELDEGAEEPEDEVEAKDGDDALEPAS
jgi:hypothetical protein